MSHIRDHWRHFNGFWRAPPSQPASPACYFFISYHILLINICVLYLRLWGTKRGQQMKLFSQSPRWCHLTTTLWSLIALESGRNVDINGVSQFLEVIHWRAHGKITEEEFSILYSEWMMLTDTPVSAGGGGGAGSSSSKNNNATTTTAAVSSPSKKKGSITSSVPVTA